MSHQTKKEQIFRLFKEKKTREEISRITGCSKASITNQLYRLKEDGAITEEELKNEKGKRVKTVLGETVISKSDSIVKEITTKQEIKHRQESARVKDLEKKVSRLVLEYGELMNQYDNALLLQQPSDAPAFNIDLKNKLKGDAIPIIQFSDWHVEERIEKRTTMGLNEFNPDIAEARVEKLTQNTIRLIDMTRQDSDIKEIFICLGGDFFNNYLHEHDTQMNFMSPIEAAVFAKTLLVKSIKTLAEQTDIEKIHLMCIRGNHGRLTKRMQSSNDYKMNLEAVIYYMMKQELTDSIFEWYIPESEHGYIELFNKTIRCFHGHQIKYQGGLGDLTIPVNKAISRWDKTQKADWNLMSHFHSFWMPTRNTSLNGSLCGWNSYALSCGFQYEPPLQSFHLLDRKRGFTVRVPIFCE